MDCYALKPVISAKYNLWGGFETCESLAEKLNTEIRDPYSEDGYSLVAVHSWSNSVDSLLYVRSLLEQGVRVVAPDEFVSLISKAICSPIIPDSPEIEVVPNPVLDDVRFRLRGICCEDYQIKISDMTGKEFDFDFEDIPVSGFVAMREKGRVSQPGFCLFWCLGHLRKRK